MIISVFHPVTPENTFDLDYYLTSHLSLVKRLLGPMGLRDTRVLTAAPDSTYPVIAELTFDDLKSLKAALAAHNAQIQADIPNFTDVTPLVQISEIAQVR